MDASEVHNIGDLSTYIANLPLVYAVIVLSIIIILIFFSR